MDRLRVATPRRWPGYLFVAALTLSQGVIADDLRTPTCEELSAWTSSIDVEQRWQPFPENPRVWLPQAMQHGDFQALFGKAALDWTQADIAAARGLWNGCIVAARKARDKALQKALTTSRNYLNRNLLNALRYQERSAARAEKARQRQAMIAQRQQEQARIRAARAAEREAMLQQQLTERIDVALTGLLAQPPSVQALRALTWLSTLDIDDDNAIGALQGNVRTLTDYAVQRTTQQLLQNLQQASAQDFELNVLPRLNPRLAEVKTQVLESLREQFSQSPADPNQRRALAQRYEAVMNDLQPVLSDQQWRSLADETRSRRQAIVAAALAEGIRQIDQVPNGSGAIARVEQIVRRTSARGLNGQQSRELRTHARSRQQALADALLHQAIEQELAAVPESWAGFAALDALNARLAREVNRHASPAATEAFVAAFNARRAAVGRQALPEFKQQLAALAADPSGLVEVEERIQQLQGWRGMEPSIRQDYLAAAQTRHDQIAAAVEQERQRRRAEALRDRQLAIAAGGDPRIVGYTWAESNGTMAFEFRDQETVFMNLLGIRAAGTYRVSRDDVVVTAPHGQMVLTIKNGQLLGNGLVFKKQDL